MPMQSSGMVSSGGGGGGLYGSLLSQLQGRQARGLPGNMQYLMQLLSMMPQGGGGDTQDPLGDARRKADADIAYQHKIKDYQQKSAGNDILDRAHNFSLEQMMLPVYLPQQPIQNSGLANAQNMAMWYNQMWKKYMGGGG